MLRVSNIQRFSTDDGPGIRTTVFLKGCDLRCRWCHNPETISVAPNLLFDASKCIHCGQCSKVCDQNVHSFEGKIHNINRGACIACSTCVDICPAGALDISGREWSCQDVMDELLKDADFYARSGGGVTFSGGEPLLQADELSKLMKRCKEAGIHIAIDTAGFVGRRSIDVVRPYCDLFLYDLKCYSSSLHRKFTGKENQVILENLEYLCTKGAKVILRTPVINGFNTDIAELTRMAEFIAALPGKEIELCQLLPYHKMGLPKYQKIGMDTDQSTFSAPTEAELEKICRIFTEEGIPTRIR